jgi:glycosyltransferase involved in cell wall biosynthesis
MRLLIVTDAWFPQVNGVVRTLDTLIGTLRAGGHTVGTLTPDRFATLPCPSYPEIRLALVRPRVLNGLIDRFQPNAIHIATEGPLGQMVRRLCRRRGWSFTTSFHTLFPEYIEARWRLPARWSYPVLRRLHAAARHTLVATGSLEAHLQRHGFTNLRRWSRGVDTSLFRPRPKDFLSYPRPISLYVGRLAVEKSVEDFLKLDLPGTKLVVGDGPDRAALQQRYPEAVFAGVRVGEDLAQHYAAADVFVFPSRTDTFGLVMLEALAAGVPVAAYPVAGPLDVIDGSGAGCLSEDLGAAVRQALTIDPALCRQHALCYSWEKSARQFLENVVKID